MNVAGGRMSSTKILTFDEHITLKEYHELRFSGDYYTLAVDSYRHKNLIVHKDYIGFKENGLVRILHAYAIDTTERAVYIREMQFHITKVVISNEGPFEGLEKIVKDELDAGG